MRRYYIIAGQLANGRTFIHRTPDDRVYVEDNCDSIVYQKMFTYGYAYCVQGDGRTADLVGGGQLHEVADLDYPATLVLSQADREDYMESVRYVERSYPVRRIKDCTRKYKRVRVHTDIDLSEIQMQARVIKVTARKAREKYATVS